MVLHAGECTRWPAKVLQTPVFLSPAKMAASLSRLLIDAHHPDVKQPLISLKKPSLRLLTLTLEKLTLITPSKPNLSLLLASMYIYLICFSYVWIQFFVLIYRVWSHQKRNYLKLPAGCWRVEINKHDIIIVATKSIICGKSDIFQYIMILIFYWNNTFPVGRIKLHWIRTTLSLLVSFKHSIIICDFLLDKHQKSLSSKHICSY